MEGLTVDGVKQVAPRVEELQGKIEHFLTATQIPAGWGRFLLEVLGDPGKVERLREILAERLARSPGRDPLARLLQDHLAPSTSHRDQVGLAEIYDYYRELCRIASTRPVGVVELAERITFAFPEAVRRYALSPRWVHFCFLRLITGAGGDHV